jgi:hypothetical protein
MTVTTPLANRRPRFCDDREQCIRRAARSMTGDWEDEGRQVVDEEFPRDGVLFTRC